MYIGLKRFTKYCTFSEFDDNRIIGIKYKRQDVDILLLSVYLPYKSADNFDEFLHCLNKIIQIMHNHTSPYVYVLGDFNADSTLILIGSLQICDVNLLIISDRAHLPMDTFTFISNAHG